MLVKVPSLTFFQCINQGRKGGGTAKRQSQVAGNAAEESKPCSVSHLGLYLFLGAQPGATALNNTARAFWLMSQTQE